MRKIYSLIILFTLFSLAGSAFGKVSAASLKFDNTSYTSSVGQTIQVSVTIDAGSDTISSTDAYVLYDPTLLQAQSVAAGAFFPTVTNNITSGKVYVAGLVDNPATSKTGTGTLATITFSSLKNGSGTLTFDCQQGSTSTSKIVKNDINATNVIVCASNGSATVTVGSGSVGTPALTPTASALPKSGVIENLTNLAIPGGILLLTGIFLKLALL